MLRRKNLTYDDLCRLVVSLEIRTREYEIEIDKLRLNLGCKTEEANQMFEENKQLCKKYEKAKA